MANGLSPIEAHERTIRQIFDDTYAFEIPAYQRPYACEVEQAKELLDDLLEAMNAADARSSVYFLGSIVLIKQPNDPLSRVIDGQQRLTTLTILLSVLRDLTTDQPKRFDRGRYIFEKANTNRGTQDRFRVLLRPSDRPFFRKTIQEPGATNSLPDLEALEGSQRRLAANARWYREELERLSEKTRDDLIAYIIQHCYLVVVAVPTAEAARRIFTVLNARGLDLTATDILKAELLDRAGDEAERALADRWEAIEQATGREGMVELFGHVRMIYEREKPRSALEVGFPKFVTPFNGDADKFLSEILEPLADAFSLLKENDTIRHLFGEKAARAVRSLNRIDNKDWVSPALLRLWRRKPGKSEEVADFLVKLERLAYFLFVTRHGVNDRIARFANAMNEFQPQGDPPKNGLELSQYERAEFLRELNGDVYLKGRVCKALLQRLDEALSTGGAIYDDLVSIEHVLPQTVDPDSEWMTLFPNEIDRSEWTHRLANLVFLTHRINTKASNWDFERKKLEYFGSEDGSSPFVITQDVLQTERWTLEHLKGRQNKLLKKLADVWNLDLELLNNPSELSDTEASQRGFTELHLIEAKRKKIIHALSAREKQMLMKAHGAYYSNVEGSLKAICTLSKRYPTGSPYWYGYAPPWDEFLASAKSSFIVLGCMDRDRAYAIPHQRVQMLLPHLHRTGEKHWHLALDEDEKGELQLNVPGAGTKIKLGEFAIDLKPADVAP